MYCTYNLIYSATIVCIEPNPNTDPKPMGVICKEKVGGGDNWVINIFGATNCERRREAMLGGGGGLGACPPPRNVLKNEGHCGSDFCILSSYVYCTCSEYLNIGRE